ncbi:hypothetical protein [Embleya sp. NPDC005971]|uniref:hypothetical protein n=1 Tax=Embleya sp. NPDC005971 TaxID=3156724 RepID=UPI0033CC1012
MVDNARLTTTEIATKYGRSLSTVQTDWTQHSEWPEPVGKRGKWFVYDAEAVERVVREHLGRPATTGLDPGTLYTLQEAADALGTTYGALRSHKSRNKALYEPADDDENGVDRWYGARLERIHAKRRR